MTARRYSWFIWLLVALLGLSGCDRIPALPTNATEAFRLMATLLPSQRTETADAMEADTTPTPTAASPQPGLETPQAVDPAAGQCNLAAPGLPIDITIPDGTRLRPGQSFSKTWRLVNAGSCPWTEDYAVVWFSGEPLGLNRVQYLRSVVMAGQTVDIMVDMIASAKPGVYQSNWKLRDPDGALFGIGPTGEAPFWVRIEVVSDTATATPLPTPTVTPTSVVFVEGEILLRLGERFDLERGQPGEMNATEVDLAYQMSAAEVPTLAPLESARLGYFGIRQPSLNECKTLNLESDPTDLRQVNEGDYFCFRSTQGLIGFVRLTLINLEANTIRFKYTTWAVP